MNYIDEREEEFDKIVEEYDFEMIPNLRKLHRQSILDTIEKCKEIVGEENKRMRCSACDGANCGHTLGCISLQNILQALNSLTEK